MTNLDARNYTIKTEAQGFQAANFTIQLTARETARVDAQLCVATF